MTFEELLAQVQELTGLELREAARVAMEFDDDATPLPQEIVDKAIALGYDVERKHGRTHTAAPAPDVTTDPAEVLTEVYMCCPRVLCEQVPRIGRAPEQPEMAQFADFMAELPEDARVALVKIDLFEGKATFWLRDEANDVDRPIGPIDLKRYTTESAMRDAFMELLKRLDRVLAADFN